MQYMEHIYYTTIFPKINWAVEDFKLITNCTNSDKCLSVRVFCEVIKTDILLQYL